MYCLSTQMMEKQLEAHGIDHGDRFLVVTDQRQETHRKGNGDAVDTIVVLDKQLRSPRVKRIEWQSPPYLSVAFFARFA